MEIISILCRLGSILILIQIYYKLNTHHDSIKNSQNSVNTNPSHLGINGLMKQKKTVPNLDLRLPLIFHKCQKMEDNPSYVIDLCYKYYHSKISFQIRSLTGLRWFEQHLYHDSNLNVGLEQIPLQRFIKF